ncbi:MAG: protein kinase [Thermoanaerobaculia bacterium]
MYGAPQRIAHFDVLRILGRGGMGVVYLARDSKLGRQVALKVLTASDLEGSEQRSRFLREARTAASISHPNVATIFEIGETDVGLPFIAMEYCEGPTLAQLRRDSEISRGDFLRWARQIAEGLSAAHRNGVIHRDIKTANIVASPSGIKILDFGLARELVSDAASLATTGGHFYGTIPYLSPEQATGRRVDARSDLFSTGVVLYELATGKLPFEADTPLQILERIRDDEPDRFEPAIDEFPPEATRIIEQLLQKSPEDRYQSAEELAADLTALQGAERPASDTVRESRRVSTLGKTVRASRRRTGIIGLLALLLVLILGSAIGWFLHQAGGEKSEPPADPSSIHSIAVVPFENVSGQKEDQFLSVGLADALVTRLQMNPALQVRPTSSTVQLEGKRLDAQSRGKQLDVDGVLEGRFLSAGSRLRVTLQLTDTRSGYGVWADTVEGSRDNLLTLIDDVSGRTASALDREAAMRPPSIRSEPKSSNPKAFEYYVRARAIAGSLRPEESSEEVALLSKAIELDPEFAAAYADMAIALSLRQVRGFGTTTEQYKRAEWYARQAIRLDSNLAEAHLALGRALVRFPDRFRESARETLAALRLNPNDPQALWTMVTYFVATGETQKAQCAGERLVRLDPSSNEARTRGYWKVNSVDAEGSLRESQYALASPDTALAGHDMRALAWLVIGDLDAAEREQQAAEKLVPEHYIPRSLAAMIAAARGNRAEVERRLAQIRTDTSRNHWAALRASLCYAKLGDRNEAIAWMKKAMVLGNHSWYFFVKHPWFESLQSDPEFQRNLAKMKSDLDDVQDDYVGTNATICGK